MARPAQRQLERKAKEEAAMKTKATSAGANALAKISKWRRRGAISGEIVAWRQHQSGEKLSGEEMKYMKAT